MGEVVKVGREASADRLPQRALAHKYQPSRYDWAGVARVLAFFSKHRNTIGAQLPYKTPVYKMELPFSWKMKCKNTLCRGEAELSPSEFYRVQFQSYKAFE